MTLPRQPGLDPQLALRLDDPKRGVLGGVRPAHPAGYSCLVYWSELSDNPWDAQTPAELRSRLAAKVPGLTRFDRAEVERFLARRPGREHHIMVSPAFHDHSGHVALLGGRLCWKMHPKQARPNRLPACHASAKGVYQSNTRGAQRPALFQGRSASVCPSA